MYRYCSRIVYKKAGYFSLHPFVNCDIMYKNWEKYFKIVTE